MFDRLWTGWRSAYVTAAKERLPEDPTSAGSIFTQMLNSGQADTEIHIVWRGTHCFALMNAYPYTSGHVMVLPYREVADLELLTTPESAELWRAVTDAVTAVKAAYSPEGVNVGINLGKAAGGSVSEHLHVHIVPRRTGDSNFMAATAHTRIVPEPLDMSADKVRQHWPT